MTKPNYSRFGWDEPLVRVDPHMEWVVWNQLGYICYCEIGHDHD